MNTYMIAFSILFCCCLVSGRHINEQEENEHSIKVTKRQSAHEMKKHNGNRPRRHYRPPCPDHNNSQVNKNKINYGTDHESYPYISSANEYTFRVMEKINEISNYVKLRQQPVIYVPVPVVYPNSKCSNSVNVNSRDAFGTGIDNTDAIIFKEEVPPSKPSVSTENPLEADIPTYCDAVIINCCRRSFSQAERRRCFSKYGCGSLYAKGNACTNETIQSVLKYFSEAYGPAEKK